MEEENLLTTISDIVPASTTKEYQKKKLTRTIIMELNKLFLYRTISEDNFQPFVHIFSESPKMKTFNKDVNILEKNTGKLLMSINIENLIEYLVVNNDSVFKEMFEQISSKVVDKHL